MFYSKEDILMVEHETLCDVAPCEPSNDFVAGEIRGILLFACNLLYSKKEGDS